MTSLKIGRFTIGQIVELEEQKYKANAMLPDATQEGLREQSQRLGPRFIEPETLDLFLTFGCYVVRTGRHNILVDGCIGEDKERPTRPVWHRRKGPFLSILKSYGLTPEDIDVVLCTHLHADHVGWNTRLVNGKWVPSFPRARYLIAEPEYRHWKSQHDAAKEPILHGSFADSVLPVVQSGQAVMVKPDHEVEAGVRLEPAFGHTPGNVVIHVEDGNARAVLLGDVMHHPVQVAYPEWSTNFCTDPAASRRTRASLLQRCANTETRVLTAHFARPTVGRVVRDGARFAFQFEG